MSEQEYIYIHSPLALPAEARLLSDLLDMQLVTEAQESSETTEMELTGSARASGANRVAVWVELNDRASPDRPPELTSAADDYPFEVYIRVFGGSEEGQAAEARWIFVELVKRRPEIPMLLTHERIDLLAAYLPGRCVHDFPLGTEVDPADEAEWRAWVPTSAEPNTP